MSARTTYVTAPDGSRLGMRVAGPEHTGEDRTYVVVTTTTASLGFYDLARAGDAPLTASGALSKRGAETLAAYIRPV